jgi:hypothetical protein
MQNPSVLVVVGGGEATSAAASLARATPAGRCAATIASHRTVCAPERSPHVGTWRAT